MAPKRQLGALLLSSGAPGGLRPDVRVIAGELGWEVLVRGGSTSTTGSAPDALVLAVVRALGAGPARSAATTRRNGRR